MKALIKYIIPALVAAISFSCGDKFIYDTLDISGVAASAIIISPEWESNNYQFQCTNAGNADFTIKSKPEWLIIDNHSGKFSGGIATINGKATVFGKYAKTGIYIDQMIVVADGKNYVVPLYYINEGDPHVLVPANFKIKYNYEHIAELTIGNTGDGILLWEIISMPEWLLLDTAQFSINDLLITQNSNVNILFNVQYDQTVNDNLSGTIVMRTNDKNNPIVTINVVLNAL